MKKNLVVDIRVHLQRSTFCNKKKKFYQLTVFRVAFPTYAMANEKRKMN